jgi:hypothetical protein
MAYKAYIGAAALLFACALPGSASELSSCGDSLLALSDEADGMPSACTVSRGSLLLESTYFQNASAFGGTALAAYPMVRFRAGATSRLEFLLDSPSQVAESGKDGAGLYPATGAGVGANYAVLEGARLSLAAGAEVQPPIDDYASDRRLQPKLLLDSSALYRVTPLFALTGAAALSDSRTVGLERDSLSVWLGTRLSADRRTDVSLDVGDRYIARRTCAQAAGDISFARLLGNNTSIGAALGTSFNPVVNTKSHYFSAAVNVRP